MIQLFHLDTLNSSPTDQAPASPLPQQWLTTAWAYLSKPILSLAVLPLGLLLLLIAALSSIQLTTVVQSAWFWGLVGLLLLNFLLILAEYGPQAWRFWHEPTFLPPTPFPLTQRFEQRLDGPSAEWPDLLNRLQPWLLKHGVAGQLIKQDKAEIFEATKRPWAWWGLPISSLGGILLVIALLVSYYNTQLERLTLYPNEAHYQPLLNSTLSLPATVDGETQLIYSHGHSETDESRQRLAVYQPMVMNGAMLLPIAVKSILTVQVEDETNQPVRLTSVPEALNFGYVLHFDVVDGGNPFYFSIPSADLTLQITPNPAAQYNVQARRSAEDAPSTNMTIPAGEPFEIEDLAIKLTLNRKAELIIFRNSGWWLYCLSLLLLIVGVWSLLIQPPVKLLLANQPDNDTCCILEIGGLRNHGEPFWQELLSTVQSKNSDDSKSF